MNPKYVCILHEDRPHQEFFISVGATWWADDLEECPIWVMAPDCMTVVGKVQEIFRQEHKVFVAYDVIDEVMRAKLLLEPESFYLAPYCNDIVTGEQISEEDLRVITKMRLRYVSIQPK